MLKGGEIGEEVRSVGKVTRDKRDPKFYCKKKICFPNVKPKNIHYEERANLNGYP